jgi:hypothetical protein
MVLEQLSRLMLYSKVSSDQNFRVACAFVFAVKWRFLLHIQVANWPEKVLLSTVLNCGEEEHMMMSSE